MEHRSQEGVREVELKRLLMRSMGEEMTRCAHVMALEAELARTPCVG